MLSGWIEIHYGSYESSTCGVCQNQSCLVDLSDDLTEEACHRCFVPIFET